MISCFGHIIEDQQLQRTASSICMSMFHPYSRLGFELTREPVPAFTLSVAEAPLSCHIAD